MKKTKMSIMIFEEKILSSAGSPSENITSSSLIVIGRRRGHREALKAFGLFYINVRDIKNGKFNKTFRFSKNQTYTKKSDTIRNILMHYAR